MQRRSFIACGASALVLAGAGARPTVAQAANATPREDIATFSRDPVKVAALRKAFKAMRARKPGAKVSWFNYAAIHGVPPDDPVAADLPADIQVYWNQCHHDEDLFFVWHRAYLSALERNLQALSGRPGLKLPYWDWYKDPALPAIFRPEFLDTARKRRNPLYNATRESGVQDGLDVWAAESSGALDQDAFHDMQAGLNFGEHGAIHMSIGGDMGAVETSARDPIFWLHHCNLDRLLVAWETEKRKAPDQSATFDSVGYKFPIEAKADYLPLAAGLDMNSKAPLGQAYESLAAPFAPTKPPIRPAELRRLGAGTRALGAGVLGLNPPTPLTVPAGGLNVAFTLPSAGDSNLNTVLNSVPLAQATSVVLVLSGVRLASPPPGLIGYDVFVNLPPGAADPLAYKIGAISVFSLTMTRGHAGHGMAMTGPVYRLPALRQLRGAGGLRSDLVVTLAPRYTLRAQVPAAAPGVTIDDIRVEVSANPTE